jgi:hypothetical protein
MNQNQARLLVGGILILLVAALAFYFQKDILNLINKPKGDIERNPQDKELTNFVPLDTTEADLSKGSVEAASEIPQYDFVILNQKKLVDLLFTWGIYDRTFDLKAFGKNTGGVDKVIFKIVKEPQKVNTMSLVSRIGESSAEINAIKSTLEVDIYFPNTAFPGIKEYISQQSLYGLYLMTHTFPPGDSPKIIEEKFNKDLAATIKDGPLFNIAKKP